MVTDFPISFYQPAVYFDVRKPWRVHLEYTGDSFCLLLTVSVYCIYFLTFIDFVCVCMCHDIHVEGRGHFFMSNFSAFTMWNPGLELVLSGLMTSSLIHRAVSLSLSHSFARGNQTQSLTQARGVLYF